MYLLYSRLQNPVKGKREELKIMRMGKMQRRVMMIPRQRMLMTKTSPVRLRVRMLRMKMVKEKNLQWMRILLQRRMTCDGNRSVMNKQ